MCTQRCAAILTTVFINHISIYPFSASDQKADDEDGEDDAARRPRHDHDHGRRGRGEYRPGLGLGTGHCLRVGHTLKLIRKMGMINKHDLFIVKLLSLRDPPSFWM